MRASLGRLGYERVTERATWANTRRSAGSGVPVLPEPVPGASARGRRV